ncbi:MAG: glycogen debranching enzyme family protein [Bacteroidetes bacterium]|nr:glycogen debranching enzyme family protein [Bacteroidota bacterium]
MMNRINNIRNIDYLSEHEYIYTNMYGGYMSTSLGFYNRRKYHSLFTYIGSENNFTPYKVLSSIDETLKINGEDFMLGIRKYPMNYFPNGNDFIKDVDIDNASTTYTIENNVFKKEVCFRYDKQQVLIKYSLVKANSDVKITINPLLTYCSIHDLLHKDDNIKPDIENVEGGYKFRLFKEMPWIFMQSNKALDFEKDIEWNMNIEYDTERERGYDYQEDLLSIGNLSKILKEKDSVTITFGTHIEDYKNIDSIFDLEISKIKRLDHDNWINTLRERASMFLAKQGDEEVVIAGYPWFGSWGRDTLISLPGLTLSQNNVDGCIKIIDSMVSKMRHGLFINMGSAYNSCDAPLWLAWTLQQLEEHIGIDKIYDKYFNTINSIIEAYHEGINPEIKVMENGLVYVNSNGKALTWMDAIVENKPVTERMGYQVEINALWYNMLSYGIDLAKHGDNKELAKKWNSLRKNVKRNFLATFYNPKNNCLYDYVNKVGASSQIRPNQIIACSLKYSPLTKSEKGMIFDITKKYLLTPKGLRTLCPYDKNYQYECIGTQSQRDIAYHNGTVWVWLLEHYVQAGFNIYGKKYKKEAKKIFDNFSNEIWVGGLGSIAEIYDAEYPHKQRGTIAQAWSVASIIRIDDLIRKN